MSTIAAAPRRTVLVDALVTNRTIATNIALIVAGTLVVAALAQVEIPLWPVPITGQTLGVIIVGASLGAWRGASSLALYLVAGLAGAPVFAGFTGGPVAVTKPSFGFILGFIVAAFIAGWAAERSWDKKFLTAFLGFVVASIVPFLIGVPYMAFILGGLGVDNSLGNVLALGVTPFIVGGIVKAAVGAAILPLAWKGVSALDAKRDR